MARGFPGTYLWYSLGSGICSCGNIGHVTGVSQIQREVIQPEGVNAASHKSRSLTAEEECCLGVCRPGSRLPTMHKCKAWGHVPSGSVSSSIQGLKRDSGEDQVVQMKKISPSLSLRSNSGQMIVLF